MAVVGWAIVGTGPDRDVCGTTTCVRDLESVGSACKTLLMLKIKHRFTCQNAPLAVSPIPRPHTWISHPITMKRTSTTMTMMQQITQQTAYFLKKSAQASGEREEVSAVHASVRRGQRSARTERVEKVEVDAEAIKQRRPHRRRQEWELVRLLAPQSNGVLQGLAARYQLDREPDRPLVALEVWMCCGHPYIVYPVRAASPQRLVA